MTRRRNRGKALRSADGAASQSGDATVGETTQPCGHWRLKVVVESTEPGSWPTGKLAVALAISGGRATSITRSAQKTCMTASTSSKLDFQGRRAGTVVLTPTFEDADDRLVWDWAEASTIVEVPAQQTVVLKAERIGVEVVSVTPSFAPGKDDVTVALRLINTRRIRTLMLEVVDFEGKPVHQKLWRRKDKTFLSGNTARWSSADNGVVTLVSGATTEPVHGLRGPFHVRAWASKEDLTTAEECKTRGVPNGLPGGTQPMTLGKDLCVVRYRVTLERLPWHEIYRQRSGGKDPATLPLDQSTEIQIMWAQYKLNEMGCFAGPITGATHVEFERAVKRYRVMRRMPLDTRLVPQGTGAELAAHGLVEADMRSYTGAKASELFYEWRSENFLFRPDVGGSLQELGSVSDERARKQLLVFLDMETASDVFDAPADLLDSAAQVKLYLDSDRYYFNFDREFIEGGTAFEADKSDRCAFEEDWFSAPCFALRAKIEVEGRSRQSYGVQGPASPPEVHFSWTDESEDPSLLPAETTAQPSRTRAYVEKAKEELGELFSSRYHNARRVVGGLIGPDEDANARAIFRRFPDGAELATTDAGVSVQVTPGEDAAIYVQTGRLAGDNYRIHTRLRVPDAAAQARLDWTNTAEPGDGYLPNGGTGAKPPTCSTAKVELWRRFHLAALVTWPARDASRTWRGQTIDQETWAQVRREFAHAYVEAPEWSEVRGVTRAIRDVPGIEERFVRAMANVAAGSADVRKGFGLPDLDGEFKEEVKAKFGPPYADINTELGKLPPDHLYKKMKDKLQQWLSEAVVTPPQSASPGAPTPPSASPGPPAPPAAPPGPPAAPPGPPAAPAAPPAPPGPPAAPSAPPAAPLASTAPRKTRSWGVVNAGPDPAVLKRLKGDAARYYLDALGVIANDAGDGFKPSLESGAGEDFGEVVGSSSFKGDGSFVAWEPKDPPDDAKEEEALRQVKSELTWSPFRDFDGEFPKWLARRALDYEKVRRAKSTIEAIPPYTRSASMREDRIWEDVRRHILDAIRKISNDDESGFRPGLTATTYERDPHFPAGGLLNDTHLDELALRYVLTFDDSCVFARPFARKSEGPLTETELRGLAHGVSGPLSFALCEVFNDAVRGALLMEVRDGKFVHRTHGVIAIDNQTFPQTDVWDEDPETGEKRRDASDSPVTRKYDPMGFSLGQPLGVTFWSHYTPMRVEGLIVHEISHLWSLKHWQNTSGMQRDGHDHADTNCVMSYPFVGGGTDAESFDDIPKGVLRRLSDAARDSYPSSKSPGVYLNAGALWVFKEHFLAKDYRPHHCGKCNLQLRGWNVYAKHAGDPVLPRASKDPPAQGVTPTSASSDYLPHRDSVTNDYEPLTFERSTRLLD